MSTALAPLYLSVDEYLAGEETSEVRHEYIGGQVFAMAGASDTHNTISLNVAAALRTQVRGGPCRVFIGDVKVRLISAGKDMFYYPDVLVACDPRDRDPYFKRFPKVVIEVLSEATERTDRREKFWSYTQMETLEEYLLIAQNRMEVTIFRRTNHWKPEVLQRAEEVARLDSLKFELPLSMIYEETGI